MRKVSDKKLAKEWERATKYRKREFVTYDEKTGRPLFKDRHPALPLIISVVALLLVIGKPFLLYMLQLLQKWLCM